MEPVRIQRIAAGGDGVGRLADGRTVFVPRAAPGDLVEITDVRLHARFARARVGRLVEPGPGRVEPRCRHYTRDDCGGCQLQHLGEESQRAARRTIVGDALRRLAKLDLPDPALEPTLRSWGYRTRISLAVDTGGHAGFHPVDRPDTIFDLEQCEIAAPELNRLWQKVRAARTAWPAALGQIVLRLGRDGGVHVVFKGPVKPAAEMLQCLGAGTAILCWWQPAEGRARLLTAGQGSRSDPAAAPATVFEQVNPTMGDRVRVHALRELGDVSGRHVWDLYAGIGEASARLSEGGASVESVEREPDAVAFAERAGPSRGIRRHVGRVEEWVTRLQLPAKVLTNPPRTGMAAGVVTAIMAARPETVVYVSCDPATLARDLARFKANYRVASVTAFDLFPQTAHVETVVRLDQT